MVAGAVDNKNYLLDMFRRKTGNTLDLPSGRFDSRFSSLAAEPNPEPTMVSSLESKIAAKFVSIFGEMVSLPSQANSIEDFRNLVFAYEADWNQLSKCRSEWMKLCESIVRVNTSFDKDKAHFVSDEAKLQQQKWRGELFHGLAWPLSIRSALEAKLSILPISDSIQILENSINKLVSEMAAHMARQLAVFTDDMVLGTIAWYGKHACQYTFVERNVVFTKVARTGKLSALQPDYENGLGRQTVFVEGTMTKAIVVHTHDLIDAIKSHPSNTKVPVPEIQQSILSAIPSWLLDDTRIAEGNLIRERVYQMDISTETISLDYDVTVPMHFDPAIVLANSFVLTGWKPEPQ